MPEVFFDWRTETREEMVNSLCDLGFVPEFVEDLTDDVVSLIDRAYEYGVRDA